MTLLSWRIVSAAFITALLTAYVLRATAEPPRSLPPIATPCISAEDCFRSAVAINERSGSLAQRDQAMALKIDQLRSVMDLYPSTIWAKRAGVVLGVLLTERTPAEAVKLLRAAQSDIPILDDYLRLWIGESLLSGVAVVTATGTGNSVLAIASWPGPAGSRVGKPRGTSREQPSS